MPVATTMKTGGPSWSVPNNERSSVAKEEEEEEEASQKWATHLLSLAPDALCPTQGAGEAERTACASDVASFTS